MTFQTAFCTAAIAACLSLPAIATPIVGTVADTSPVGGYMGDMTDIRVLSGSDLLPGTAFVFCIDRFASFPEIGNAHQYTVSNSFAQVMAHPGAIGMATGLLHYVVDYYYGPLMAGAFGAGSGYDFNRAMWEITSDFDGTVGSLDTDWGVISGAYYMVYDTIIDDLRANFAAIGPDYRSKKYDIRFLDNANPDYQSLAMVTGKEASEVPEPSTLALMLAGGLGFAVRAARRRQAA